MCSSQNYKWSNHNFSLSSFHSAWLNHLEKRYADDSQSVFFFFCFKKKSITETKTFIFLQLVMFCHFVKDSAEPNQPLNIYTESLVSERPDSCINSSESPFSCCWFLSLLLSHCRFLSSLSLSDLISLCSDSPVNKLWSSFTLYGSPSVWMGRVKFFVCRSELDCLCLLSKDVKRKKKKISPVLLKWNWNGFWDEEGRDLRWRVFVVCADIYRKGRAGTGTLKR